jgi:hypothetical protein
VPAAAPALGPLPFYVAIGVIGFFITGLDDWVQNTSDELGRLLDQSIS